MPLKSFTVVLIGDSFPVSSLRLSDLAFRHREIRETLRVGPAVQGETRGVEVGVIPNRFSLLVTEVDHLETQLAGARQLVDAFRELIGSRTITAVGNNAQVVFSRPVAPDALLDRLFRADELRDVLQQPADLRGKAVYSFRRGNETITNVTIGLEDNGEALVDFNFHYDLAESRDPVAALDELPSAVEAACLLASRFEAVILSDEVVQ